MPGALLYLRRGVPWSVVLGCVGLAALVAGAVAEWPDLAGIGVPLLVLTTAAAASFVYDEPALAVTVVTPRGDRWARALRLLTALPVAAVGAALLVMVPEDVVAEPGAWVLVLVAVAGLAVLAVLVATTRQVGRPGAAVAAAVVLIGLVPLVVGMFLDLRSPYPAPDLAEGVGEVWTVVAIGSAVAAQALVRGRP